MKLSYRFTLRHAAILCLTAVLAVSTACNKDETEDEDSTSGTTKVPEFVTYTPEYAEVGVETEAMVLGRNFGTDASKISVTLGDTQMAIREVGKSVIKFTVPATLDIGTYPLRAQVTYADPEGLEQTASHTFEVDFEVRGRVPEVTGYKPEAGIYPGGELTIEGREFGSDPSLVRVTLGELPLEIKSVAPGAIVVTIPEETPFGTYALTIEIKYGIDNAQTESKTFKEFRVLKKEYVATSEVYAGAGPQGADNGARLSATFFAPQSLAYDDKTGSLYVGEIYNGVRMINASGNVDYYREPQDNNPWWDGGRITCLVSIEGDRLAYTIREARDRTCKYIWLASRTSGDFPKAVGYQDYNSDFEYEDVAVNPVDGYCIVSISRWWYWRTETQFMLVSADGSTASEPNISCSTTDGPNAVWNSHISRVVFSPDGKWLYIARGSNGTDPGAGNGSKPVAYIERYPYDPTTHTLGDVDTREIIAGSTSTSETGFTDGPVGTSRLLGPTQMCFDAAGETLYFVERHNHALRKITDLDGTPTVTTVAGNGQKGSNDVSNVPTENMKEITFDTPKGLALGDDNTFYISEDGERKIIRRISISLKAQE